MPDKIKMSKSAVGRLGALARIKKYGNFGTPEGRRKGGLNSFKTHLQKHTGFNLTKEHAKPFNSKMLAEFMGVLFGDGHLSKYQVLVTTNSITDIEHALYIQSLMKKLFNLEPSIKSKKGQNAVNILVSSINLVKWLSLKGMPVGNKLTKGLSIPNWIKKDQNLQKDFIRGLFDTDGCVYVDRHVINGKKYEHYGWTITSYSVKLRNDILEILKNLRFRPTLSRTQKSVYIRRQADIERFFKEIGTHNPKHLSRYKNGRVPKRS